MWQRKPTNLLSQDSTLEKEHDKLTSVANTVAAPPFGLKVGPLPRSQEASTPVVHTSVETSVDIQLGPNSDPNMDPLDLMMFGQIIQLTCSICKMKFNRKPNGTTCPKRFDNKRPFYCKRCSRGSRSEYDLEIISIDDYVSESSLTTFVP